MAKITEEELNAVRAMAASVKKIKSWHLLPMDGTKSKVVKDFIADLNRGRASLKHDTWAEAHEEARRISTDIGSVGEVFVFSSSRQVNRMMARVNNGVSVRMGREEKP